MVVSGGNTSLASRQLFPRPQPDASREWCAQVMPPSLPIKFAAANPRGGAAGCRRKAARAARNQCDKVQRGAGRSRAAASRPRTSRSRATGASRSAQTWMSCSPAPRQACEEIHFEVFPRAHVGRLRPAPVRAPRRFPRRGLRWRVPNGGRRGLARDRRDTLLHPQPAGVRQLPSPPAVRPRS